MSEPTAAERLAAEVQKLSRSALVLASGHGPLIKLLVEYLGEQQRRITQLEVAMRGRQP